MAGLPPGINLADDRTVELLSSVSATWALATVALFLRFVCRRISKANLWWDDYLMIPAYLFTSVVSWVSLTYMPNNGFGRHIFIQPPEKIPGVVMAFLKSLFIAEVCYTGTIVFAKFSILAFYWRLFKTNPLVRYSIFVLGIIVSMWGTAVFIIVVTQCRPLKGFWDKSVPAECTVDSYKFFYGNSTPNIVTDILLMLAPFPAIWGLHLELRQKISLSGIFLVGIFVTAVSITRLVFLVSLDVTEPNVTWVFIDPQIWTCVELNIAVVCGCLPQLRPLLLLITTGSPSGTAASSARGTTDTIGSFRKGPWAKKFGSTVGRSAMMSGKGGDTVISVSDIPLVEREEGGRYVRLDHDVEGRRKDEEIKVNVRTEWAVSSVKG